MTYIRRLPAVVHGLVDVVDRFQQNRRWLAFPVAVVRKMSNDQGGSLAALIAHYGFLSLFPLILAFSAILGFVLGSDPSLKAHVIHTTERSFPALSGYISTNTQGNGLALGTGVFVALWAGLGVTRATERALNNIWAVPLAERPNLWWSRLRGLAMLAILGTAFLLSTALASLQQAGGALAVPTAVASVGGPLVLNFGLYLLAFQVLTNRHLPWLTMVPGAAVGAVGWTTLQSLGALYTRHELAHASQLYGTLAWVVGLLAWIYLGAMLTLYAAEVNVVFANHLWPRSLGRRAQTDADRLALEMLVQEHQRAAGEFVTVDFLDPSAPSAPGTGSGADQERSPTEHSVHKGVSDVVARLRAFDHFTWDLERSNNPQERHHLRRHLNLEAEELARALARLAHSDSTLAHALARFVE